ncbi:MAG: hypothetical protein GXP15_07010 [Gammaproteobacteria bacterium]|nr:hypothetical protein [Gammaproteobacteria bacterium]
MSRDFITPDRQAISALLMMFFGEDMGVTEIDASDLSDRHVATFISDDDKLVALCACDRSFAVYAGAALSMIPSDIANEMIAAGEPSETILGNYREVMNICSKLLMSDSSAHLRLGETLHPGQSADVITQLEESAAQIASFQVDIPGYGEGSLVFLNT